MSAYPILSLVMISKKGYEVNAFLMELFKKKNIYLIDNSKKIKPQHLNKGTRKSERISLIK